MKQACSTPVYYGCICYWRLHAWDFSRWGHSMFASSAQLPISATVVTCIATAWRSVHLHTWQAAPEAPYEAQKQQGLTVGKQAGAGGDSPASQPWKESKDRPVLAFTAASMSSAMLSAVLLPGMYGIFTTVPWRASKCFLKIAEPKTLHQAKLDTRVLLNS